MRGRRTLFGLSLEGLVIGLVIIHVCIPPILPCISRCHQFSNARFITPNTPFVAYLFWPLLFIDSRKPPFSETLNGLDARSQLEVLYFSVLQVSHNLSSCCSNSEPSKSLLPSEFHTAPLPELLSSYGSFGKMQRREE